MYISWEQKKSVLFEDDEINALTFIVPLLTFQCTIGYEYRNTSEAEIVHKYRFLSTHEKSFSQSTALTADISLSLCSTNIPKTHNLLKTNLFQTVLKPSDRSSLRSIAEAQVETLLRTVARNECLA